MVININMGLGLNFDIGVGFVCMGLFFWGYSSLDRVIEKRGLGEERGRERGIHWMGVW